VAFRDRESHGPKTLEFYKDFAKGKGTWIKADGADILSVGLYIKERMEVTAAR
jgi:hypothetical protein